MASNRRRIQSNCRTTYTRCLIHKDKDNPDVNLFNIDGEELSIGGIHMRGNIFNGGNVGIWIQNGSIGIGG